MDQDEYKNFLLNLDEEIKGLTLDLKGIQKGVINQLNYSPKSGLSSSHALHEHWIDAEEKGSQGLHLFFGDINGFKMINDVLGHEEGDKVIRRVGKLLLNYIQIPKLGDCYHKSGDEFIIISPTRNVEVCQASLKEHLQGVVHKAWVAKGSPEGPRLRADTLRISFGLTAVANSSDFSDAQKRAEEACQYAKSRNEFIVDYETFKQTVGDTENWSARLRCTNEICDTSISVTTRVARGARVETLFCPRCRAELSTTGASDFP